MNILSERKRLTSKHAGTSVYTTVSIKRHTLFHAISLFNAVNRKSNTKNKTFACMYIMYVYTGNKSSEALNMRAAIISL